MQNFLTWWTLVVDSLFGWLAVIVMSVPVAILAGYLGNKMKYRYIQWNR